MIMAVIDTNVIISGILFPNSIPGEVIKAWLKNKFFSITSEDIHQEVLNTMKKEKLAKYIQPKHFDLIEQLFISSQIVNPVTKYDVCKDKDDNMLFEVAKEGTADFIVSGDKKVLEVNFEPVRIITPQEFLEILEG